VVQEQPVLRKDVVALGRLLLFGFMQARAIPLQRAELLLVLRLQALSLRFSTPAVFLQMGLPEKLTIFVQGQRDRLGDSSASGSLGRAASTTQEQHQQEKPAPRSVLHA
jgi:hypothetical protein